MKSINFQPNFTDRNNLYQNNYQTIMVMPVTSFFMLDEHLVLFVCLFIGNYQVIVKVLTFFSSLVLNGMFSFQSSFLGTHHTEISIGL